MKVESISVTLGVFGYSNKNLDGTVKAFPRRLDSWVFRARTKTKNEGAVGYFEKKCLILNPVLY